MKMHFQIMIILVGTLLCVPVIASQIRQLSWEDLIPSQLRDKDPLAKLTPEQQDMALWVINTLESVPKRGPETEVFYEEIDEAMPTLKKAGINIAEIMAQRKEIQTAVVEDLKGQDVRIPG
jgi:hypothetical protein